jgi:hypothetical protein
VIKQIKFLSETSVSSAPTTSGCTRNIWVGTETTSRSINTGLSASLIGSGLCFVGGLSDIPIGTPIDTCLYDWSSGAPEGQEVIYCPLPTGISGKLIVTGSLDGTFDNALAKNNIIFTANDKIAVNVDSLVVSPTDSCINTTTEVELPQNIYYDGVYLSGHGLSVSIVGEQSIGNDGDIYIQYGDIDTSIKAKVLGTWKTATKAYQKINGDWKTITSMSPKINGEYKLVPFHTHDYGAEILVTAATCSSPATYKQICSCGLENIYTAGDVNPYAHSYELESPGSTATCTGGGWEAIYKCKDCGNITGGDAIPPTGHVLSQYLVTHSIETDSAGHFIIHKSQCEVCQAWVEELIRNSWISNNDGTHYMICPHCQEVVSESCYNYVVSPEPVYNPEYCKCSICNYVISAGNPEGSDPDAFDPSVCDICGNSLPDASWLGIEGDYHWKWCNNCADTLGHEYGRVHYHKSQDGKYKDICSACAGSR